MLFVGTGHDLFYSMDDGQNWKPLEEGLPHASVSWVVVQKQAHDVVVSTYGRGFYIMHDITPLEQGMMEPSFTEPVSLAAPRTVFREPRSASAEISFKLAAVPKAPVEFELLDAKGALASEASSGYGPRRAEPHRGGSALSRGRGLIALRTTPAENPHIWEEPRFQGQETRPVTHWGIEGAANGPLVAPGDYTLKMTVDGASVSKPFMSRCRLDRMEPTPICRLPHVCSSRSATISAPFPI